MSPAGFEPEIPAANGHGPGSHWIGLPDLYSSSNITGMIKSRSVRWAGHVTCKKERNVFDRGFWWGSPKERDHLEDPRVDGSIIPE
jgi:hypothetical protein